MSDIAARLNAALSGRYRIERALGEGGMAKVFLARDEKHNRDVAVKVLKPDIAGDIAEARFRREIEIAARLTHPHLVPLHDSGVADGLRYFVMPVITGGSLADKVGEPMPPSEVAEHVRGIASGLDYAHREGIVHRDLKPSNILVHEGQVMISDLGIALDRHEPGDARMTRAGSSLGTPAYMSPEQIEGAAELDARSDVYSLGSIVFEMLTGSRPYHAETAAGLAAHILTDPVPRASSRNPALGAEVDAVLAKAMSKTPLERFASAGELAGALDQALSPASSTAGGRRVAAVATVVVALVAAVFLLQIGAQRDRDAALAQLATVDSLVEAGSYPEAYFLARTLTHPEVAYGLDRLWDRFTLSLDVVTDPPGAAVSARPYASPDAPWVPLGTTPFNERLPRRTVSYQVVLDGYETVVVNRGAWAMSPQGSGGAIALLPEGTTPKGMVHIPAGRIDLGEYAAGLWGVEPLDLGGYFIDRLEVTNDQYAAFVRAGGYQDAQYWPAEMQVDARVIGPADVAGTFIDQTGQPGPSTWELSAPPDGLGDHPVTGVSWYEAQAYARFAGKRLPTIYHWRRAVGAWDTEHISTRSNIAGTGTMPVGATAGESEFGVEDLAGNAREWVSTTDGALPMILGGGWDDAVERFFDVLTQPVWDRSVSNGIRLMAEPNDTTGMAVADAVVPVPRRDFVAETPVGAAEFEAFRNFFSYDDVDLDARIQSVDTTEQWIRQEITFATGFSAMRMKIHLFLPPDAGPETQVVFFFPGSGVMRTTQPLQEIPWTGEEFNFLIMTGRAMVYPVLLGSMDRSDGFRYRLQDDTRAYRDHVIAWGKEIGRTLDYLETREDLNHDAVGYYGFSWGARLGAIMLAVHDRFEAGVLHGGGLSPIPVQPEADPFHYLPRVTQPVLMLNSQFDNVYPVDTSVEPYFERLGSSEKHLEVTEGGHFIDRNTLVRETLAWFDRWLAAGR